MESTSTAEVPNLWDAYIGAVEVDELDPVGAPRQEDVDRLAERVGAQALAHQSRQAVRALAEVQQPGRYHDADCTRRPDRAPPCSAPITAAMTAD